MIATPGATIIQGASLRKSRPSLSISPSDGVGGRTPRPTKLIAASSRIAIPIRIEAWTITGPIAFGSTCRKATRRCEAPRARAATMYGSRRTASGRASHHPRDHRHVDDPDRQRLDAGAGAEHRGDDDREQDRREGHQHVERSHHEAVGEAADVAGEEAERHADGERQRDGAEGDHERDPVPGGDPREDVAAEVVGAEPVLRRRSLERVLVDHLVRLVGAEQRQQHCDERYQQDEPEPDLQLAIELRDSP